jgi:uncharacterized membrane protein
MNKAIIYRTTTNHTAVAANPVGGILFYSCLFSLAMVAFRIFYSGETFFSFLVWNLFLASVPYFLSTALARRPAWVQRTRILVPLLIAWMLMIPNAFYIITDLVHLENRFVVPFWYDQALILSFVWNGLLMGILSVRQMERIITSRWALKSDWIFIYPVMLLNAFGVFIGRYLRFNSWDIIADPFSLFNEILYMVIHPVRNRFDWSMIFCYFILMTLIYCSIKKIASGKG